MTKQRLHGKASPLPNLDRPNAVTTFVVDEYDTLRQWGVREPEVHADLYTDVEPLEILTGQDAVDLLNEHPGIVSRLTTVIETALAKNARQLEELPEGSACAHSVGRLMNWLAPAIDDWEPWVRALPHYWLGPIRDVVKAWLDDDIDWDSCEVPMYAGSQGQALEFFDSLQVAALQDLGVKLVYGDRPGSTYFAAELEGDPDAATLVAIRLGLNIRFVRERDAPAPKAHPEPKPLVSARPPQPSRTDSFQGDFQPRFGIRPDGEWTLDPDTSDPLPPAELRHLHVGWLFQSAWHRIVEGIREPVQLRSDGEGNRHVHILGVGVYTVAADGTLSGRIWNTNRDLNPTLDVFTPSLLTVDGVPWQWRWLEHWQRGFAYEVESVARCQGRAVIPAELERYAGWASQVFKGRIRSGCDLRTMRRRIAHALNLDTLALQVARQLCLTERQPRATMAFYNRAIEHRVAHHKLTTDAPRLQLTYALLGHGAEDRAGIEAPDDEPLERLRRRIKAHGLSQHLWRALLVSGNRLWRPMERFYARCDAEAAWDYLRLLDHLGWRQEPDTAFMQLVLAQYGSAHQRRQAMRHRFAGKERVLASIVRHFEALDEPGRKALLSDLPMVLNWLCTPEVVSVQKARRIPAWVDLVRRARRVDTGRLRRACRIHRCWPCPTVEPREPDQELEIVVLSTAEALHDEGDAMRHCAARYAVDCAEGKAQVASVRDRKTGKSIATVLWRRARDGWVLAEVVGFANGPAPSRVMALLEGARLIESERGAHA